MKLTWTFYPPNQPAVSLTVIYVPALDSHVLKGGGFLHQDSNTAYVDWETYRRFDDPSVQNRKDAFARLERLSDEDKGRFGTDIVLQDT